MTVARTVKLKRAIPVLIFGSFLLHLSCDEVDPLPPPITQSSESLTQADVHTIIAHGVEESKRLAQHVVVAVSDREGNVLGVFRMAGAHMDSTQVVVAGTSVTITNVDIAIRKARTAAFLSSDQHAFSTLTACYTTRPNFPPGVANVSCGRKILSTDGKDSLGREPLWRWLGVGNYCLSKHHDPHTSESPIRKTGKR